MFSWWDSIWVLFSLNRAVTLSSGICRSCALYRVNMSAFDSPYVRQKSQCKEMKLTAIYKHLLGHGGRQLCMENHSLGKHQLLCWRKTLLNDRPRNLSLAEVQANCISNILVFFVKKHSFQANIFCCRNRNPAHFLAGPLTFVCQ